MFCNSQPNLIQVNLSSESITVCFFNARSLVNKLPQFQSLVLSLNYDVICVTETWLTDLIFDQEILPSNYIIHRNDRKSRGGGVLIATKSSIHATSFSNPDHLEIVSLLLHLHVPLALCCIYIPPTPDSSYIANLITYISEDVSSHCKDIVLLGDFNMPDIDWSTLSSSSHLSVSFCDFIFDLNLSQLIDKPTHTKGNILDLILTNSCHRITNINISPPKNILNSDHSIIDFSLSHSVTPHSKVLPQYVFDFPKADYNGLCSFLMDINYSPLLSSDDVNFIWSSLKSIIYSGMNLYVPKVRLRRYQYPSWFTPELRHLSKCLRTTRKRVSKHPSVYQQHKLSQLEGELHSKILAAKSSHEANLIHSFAGKYNNKIYDYIRSLSSDNSIPSQVVFNSSAAASDFDRASLFNKFFHSVFTTSSYCLPPIETLPLPPVTIDNVSISQLDVLNALESLDASKAMGIDGIPPKLLKHCSLALYIPVHHLFSVSLTKHVIPCEWKCHSITPIHKSGDKSQVTNYRPISLLCIMSKVLERLVYNDLNKFIIQNNIISCSQFGFRQGHSTNQQLLLFLHKVHQSLNNKENCDVIYLDFRKAFDSVPHNELLTKLWTIGITGNCWYWIREYLSGRSQQVCVNGCHSSSLPVISGVPQGSILGPLLFLLYVNNLPNQVLHSTPYLFADDTKCLKSVSSSSDSLQLQQDLDNLTAWSADWKLSFNELKCILLSFQPNNSSNYQLAPTPTTSQYQINGHRITSRLQHKDLGVVMSHDLSWTNHLTSITNQAYKKLGLLRRSFSSVTSVSAKKSLYLSLIRSQLIYCSQVWRPHLVKDIKLLENVQRRATKFILNDYTSDYKTRLLKLQLLPLSMIYELNDICFLIKSIKQPSSSFNILKYISFSHNNTRSGSFLKLVQPLVLNTRHKHFFFIRITRLWNSLPPIDIYSRSYNSTVTNIKSILWNHFISEFNPSNSCTFHYCCPCPKCQALVKPSFHIS